MGPIGSEVALRISLDRLASVPFRAAVLGLGRMVALGMAAGGGLLLWLIVLADAWPALDVLSPLGPHAMAGTAVAVAAYLANRYAWLVLSSGLVVIALVLAQPASWPDGAGIAAPMAQADASVSEPRLAVLQINTWHGNRDLDGLVGFLEASDADVVVLAEFGPSKQHLVGRLARSYPHVAGCPEYWPCSQLLLSRRPFAASGARAPDASGPPYVWARFEDTAGGSPVTVVGTHLYRPSRSHRLHERQLAGLIRFLASVEGELILAGDLNMTEWSRSYERLLAATGLVASSLRLPTWPAWPLTLPQFQIDHLLVSGGLRIERQGRGPYVGSDHLPLHTVLRLSRDTPRIAARRALRATR